MPQTRIDGDAARNALLKAGALHSAILTVAGHFMQAPDAGLSASSKASDAVATGAPA